MAGKSTYLLSDIHLGAGYIHDPKRHERIVVEFLDSIKKDADAIYLLGDVLDYWYEYRYVVPRGFVRFFGKIAELADTGIKIYWFIGNHDIWIFDYLPKELGVNVIDGYAIENIHGYKCFLSHGDGVGEIDRKFRFIRSLFRNRFCQKLYSAIHPRWSVAFAHSWSSHSRKEGEYKTLSKEYLLKPLIDFSRIYKLENPDIDFFIFGHLHLLLREKINVINEELKPQAELIILGDWIKTFSYARISDEGLELLKYNFDKENN